MSVILPFVWQEDGATAIEYGLIVSLISVVIILSVSGVGKSLNNVFTNINAALNR